MFSLMLIDHCTAITSKRLGRAPLGLDIEHLLVHLDLHLNLELDLDFDPKRNLQGVLRGVSHRGGYRSGVGNEPDEVVEASLPQPWFGFADNSSDSGNPNLDVTFASVAAPLLLVVTARLSAPLIGVSLWDVARAMLPGLAPALVMALGVVFAGQAIDAMGLAAPVQLVLLELELAGRVARLPQQRACRSTAQATSVYRHWPSGRAPRAPPSARGPRASDQTTSTLTYR